MLHSLLSALPAIHVVPDMTGMSRAEDRVDAFLVALTAVGYVVTVAYIVLLSYVAGMPV